MKSGKDATMNLHIRLLQEQDIEPIAAAFLAIGWNKPAAQYVQYLAEQEAGQRPVLVALVDDVFAGYVTVLWQSDYPPFRAEQIPEIADFNVLPHLRRRGIGSRLLDKAEATTAERSDVVGIGVGMYPDYGPAQRLYVKRGYIPDGRGLTYQYHVVKPMEPVINDDDLVLYFTKRLMVLND
jgi:GNAT superfamily N-acetyltransferase